MTARGGLLGKWSDLERPLRALPRGFAVFTLLAIAAALVWSALAFAPVSTGEGGSKAVVVRPGSKGDLALYSRIAGRVSEGEGYYSAALAEQRAHRYATAPFMTVRTPIMAWGTRLWGELGWRVIAFGLLLANVLAWTMRLAPRTAPPERVAAALLVFAGGLAVFNAKYVVLHDLFAGLLVSLALALYRPGRWWPSWLAVAAALAIRELALPFVLLWAAFALAQRRWHELVALLALLVLFAAGMALHAEAVAGARLPGDLTSRGWIEMIGPAMFLVSLSELTPLLVAPPWLAGPLALLPLLGWAGLGGRLGLFATLWFAGFALAMALLAKSGNFYWALLVLPAYGGGLALVPRALGDLGRAALGKI